MILQTFKISAPHILSKERRELNVRYWLWNNDFYTWPWCYTNQISIIWLPTQWSYQSACKGKWVAILSFKIIEGKFVYKSFMLLCVCVCVNTGVVHKSILNAFLNCCSTSFITYSNSVSLYICIYVCLSYTSGYVKATERWWVFSVSLSTLLTLGRVCEWACNLVLLDLTSNLLVLFSICFYK